MSKGIKYIVFTIILIAILGLSFSTFYYRSEYKKAQSLVSNPQEIAKNEIAAIVSKISKSMDLPSEEPTLATVLEADKLREQPFFSKAENGDKVLIYTQAKKAILYRPSQNKIIDVSPLSLSNTTDPSALDTPTTPTPTAKTTPTPTEEASEDTPNPSTTTE